MKSGRRSLCFEVVSNTFETSFETMMTQPLNSGQMRRTPQQPRAIERVNRILDAAEQLFIEVGYEATTTKAIAARAEIPIGSLYQFFPSKSAIAKALAVRYTEQIHKLFLELHTEEATYVPLDVYIDRTVEAFNQFFLTHPGYRAVFVQLRVTSPEVQAVDADLNQRITQELASFFTKYNPDLDQAACELVVMVGCEMASVLQLLSLSRDEAFREQVVAETKKLLLGYWKPYLQRE